MTEFLSYRNQSIDLQRKEMDWSLYDKDPVMKNLKVTSTRKVFLAMFYPLMYEEWIFLFEEKVMIFRYLDLCVFDESPNIKIYDVITDIPT